MQHVILSFIQKKNRGGEAVACKWSKFQKFTSHVKATPVPPLSWYPVPVYLLRVC